MCEIDNCICPCDKCICSLHTLVAIMSIFSSLNYFLKRASSAVHQAEVSTQSFLNLFPEEYQFSNQPLEIGKNDSSTDSIINYTRYTPFLLGLDKLSNEVEIFSTTDIPTTKNWTCLTSLFNSIPTAYLEVEDTNLSESNAQYPNATFVNAEFLEESWWNIFDTRYLRHGWGWTITLIIAYLLILVAGVIGNSMVILVVLLRPQMRSVTNMFIMNLAVADLFVIVFCVPSTLLANIFVPWILGSFMCKSVAYIQGVSVCASAYSLAAISLDRCQAIYRNYERPRGFSQTICVRTVFIIWVAALTLTIPWAVIFEVKVSQYDGLHSCVESWATEKLGNIYFVVVNLFCFYAIPLLLIFVSNWIIYCRVTHRKVPQKSASSASIRKLHRQTRHDVLKMLGIVTLTFLFSWLPLYILVIRIKFSENIGESEYNVLGILVPIAQWLGSWNSSINPILYAFLNKKFRRMFKSILPAWIPIKAAGQYQGSIKTPSFTTTAYTGRSCARSRTNSKSDYHRHHPYGHRNSNHQTNFLVSRFHEHTGTVATTAVQIIATSALVTPTFRTIDTATAERTKNEIITDL